MGPGDPRPAPRQVIALALLLTAAGWALSLLADRPWAATPAGRSTLRISVRHVTGFAGGAPGPSETEIAGRPAHMRPVPGDRRPATGRRADARLEVEVDGRTLLARTYRPTGLRRDGPVYGYEEVALPPGRHRVRVSLRDLAPPGQSWQLEGDVQVPPGQAPLVEYVPGSGWSRPGPG